MSLERFHDLLACPCGGGFALGRCACGVERHTSEGVLVVRGEAEEDPIRSQEEKERDRQARIYDLGIAWNLPSRLEGTKIRKLILPAANALEIGCGTGRLTVELARRCERVVAVDRSLQSLKTCRAKLEAEGLGAGVLLIKADIALMPLAAKSFDQVVMAQVLEHLPDSQIRQEAVAMIARACSHRFILSAYEFRAFRSRWRKKQGFHSGGIFYERFSKSELETLLGTHFATDSLESCLGELIVWSGTPRG